MNKHVFRHSLISLFFLLTACGASPREDHAPPVPTAQIQCADGPRHLMDCESNEWAYEGRTTEARGGFTASSWLSVQAEGKSEERAIRQVSDQLMAFSVKWKRLCQSFNSCAILRSEYNAQNELLGERLDVLSDAWGRITSAQTPDSEKRQALATAYAAVVPAEERTGLELAFSALNESGAVISNGQSLVSGDRVAFVVRSDKAAHLYLLQKSGSGEWTVLYPDSRIQTANPVSAGSDVRIPSGNTFFRLNDQDIGTESVFIVASLRKLTSMEQVATAIEGGVPLAQSSADLSELSAGGNRDADCTRGLELDADPKNCVASRGLVLESDDTASVRVKSEAADDIIVHRFTFEHRAAAAKAPLP